MIRYRCIILLALLVSIPAMGEGNKYALLVGVTKYDNNSKRDLEGPANDVALFQEMLEKQFLFPKDHIRVLKETDAKARPTHANILKELDELAKTAKADDRIVVYFSGHGSQAPRFEKPDDKTPSGLKGLFLPCDIGKWNQAIQAIDSALEDNEISEKSNAIIKTGANLWLVVDSCHSGGLGHEGDKSRSFNDEISRDIDPHELGVPKELLDQGQKRDIEKQEKTRGVPTSDSGFRFAIDSPKMAATYACRTGDETPELPLPKTGDEARSKKYGLFTFTLVESLQTTSGRVTYSELIERINRQYAAAGRLVPFTVVEGGGRDRTILGDEVRRNTILLNSERDAKGKIKTSINAGILAGLNTGSVLEVFPPAGEKAPEKRIGYVKVTKSKAVSAEVESTSYGDATTPVKIDELPNGSVCRAVYYDFGLEPLTVSVSSLETKNPVAEELRATIVARLQSFANESKLIQVVDDEKLAVWRIHIVKTKGKGLGLDVALRKTVGDQEFIAPTTDSAEAWLVASLSKIARVENLLSVAGVSEKLGGNSNAQDVDVELSVTRIAGTEKQVFTPGKADMRLFDGDQLEVNIVNKTSKSVDVSLFFIDNDDKIQQVFPSKSTQNQGRIGPGTTRVNAITGVNAETTGLERFVLIATSSQDIPQAPDLSYLEESGIELPHSRGNKGFGESGVGLDQLLMQNQFPKDGIKSRGINTAKSDIFRVQILQWITAPSPK